VDYVALLSPAYIGQSGYGTILVKTLPDPRAFNRQAYSVVVTLEPGLGYALGLSQLKCGLSLEPPSDYWVWRVTSAPNPLCLKNRPNQIGRFRFLLFV